MILKILLNSTKRVKSKSINDEIGYINKVCERHEDIPGILIHLRLKSIIIDLRNYPAFIVDFQDT
jgi:hypothetical protein